MCYNEIIFDQVISVFIRTLKILNQDKSYTYTYDFILILHFRLFDMMIGAFNLLICALYISSYAL